MNKRITALTMPPHAVRLADKAISLFIDPDSGQIFLDEGDGDDRWNSAVLKPRRLPEFAVAGGHLVVHYAGRRFDLGELVDGIDAAAWVESANRLLVAKVGPTAAEKPLEHGWHVMTESTTASAVIQLVAPHDGGGIDLASLQPVVDAIQSLPGVKWKVGHVQVSPGVSRDRP